MEIILNKDQSKGLSNFFFDLAKGFVFGGFGSFIILNWQLSIILTLLNLFLAYRCVIISLNLLKE